MMTVQPTATALEWTRHYFYRGDGEIPGTQIAYYRLSDLVKGDVINTSEGRGLLMSSGLLDLTWQVMWADSDPTPDEELEEKIGNVQGYAIFMHGWTGNHAIWESIPGLVVTGNRRLVAIALDHNGFGDSRFAETPQIEVCNPPADMKVVEALIDVLKIRRQPGQPNLKVINFIGHSMGGAALFYLNPLNDWRVGEQTRLALAPALLLDDEVKKLFYTALGIGIGLVNRIHVFEVIERAIKPQVLDALTIGSSTYVRQLHADQYQRTPRGTTATTFMAMGLLHNREIPQEWSTFKVMLGHRDPLVGLIPMMDMLSKLSFPAANIRVVVGSHYFFSVGPETVYQHAQNRELVVQDILDLHERAYALQRTGVRVG